MIRTSISYDGARGYSFTLDTPPPTVSHHAKSIVRLGGKYRLADKRPLVDTKDRISKALLRIGRPADPIDSGPVRLVLSFYFAPRKRGPLRFYHDEKPDLSNIIKTVEDLIVKAGWMSDDKQVCELIVRKHESDSPRIEVSLFRLPQELGGKGL